MKHKRLLISFCLILSLLAGAFPRANAADETGLIRQMINYFRHYQESARTDILRLLGELDTISPDAALRWNAIMENWLWTEEELDLRSGELADGLPDDDSLCIITLGYQLTPTGGMSRELVGRMEVTLAAAKKYPNAYIIVTGGATASGNKSATEAGRMAAWLESNGIASDRIIRETKAYSTEANAINCLKLLNQKYPQVKHLALITSDYHMQYSFMLFSARAQLQYGGKMDMVGAACYNTGNYSGYSYQTQAEAVAAIAGVSISKMSKPTLSKVTDLTVLGDTVYSPGESLDLSAMAIYDTGGFRDVTDWAVFSGYDSTKLGRQSIRVEYTENGTRAVSDIDILVQIEEAYVTLPTQALPQEYFHTEEEPESETRTEDDTQSPSLWWLLVLIPAAIGIYELRERHLRKKRRRQRRRKPIRWE